MVPYASPTNGMSHTAFADHAGTAGTGEDLQTGKRTGISHTAFADHGGTAGTGEYSPLAAAARVTACERKPTSVA